MVLANVGTAGLVTLYLNVNYGLAGEEEELANLVERLDKASTAYGMEISAEKTKLITNNAISIETEIKVNEQKLDTVTELQVPGFSYD